MLNQIVKFILIRGGIDEMLLINKNINSVNERTDIDNLSIIFHNI